VRKKTVKKMVGVCSTKTPEVKIVLPTRSYVSVIHATDWKRLAFESSPAHQPSVRSVVSPTLWNRGFTTGAGLTRRRAASEAARRLEKKLRHRTNATARLFFILLFSGEKKTPPSSRSAFTKITT
jgi:hypothetical protein